MNELGKWWQKKVLANSLMISMSVTPPIVVDQAVAINKGVPANFTGVLLPEWQFHRMSEDLNERDFLRQELDDLKRKEEPSPIKHLLIGFLAGSMTILVIDKVGGK